MNYQEERAVDLVERSLLGTIVVCPYLFERAKSLSRSDFRSAARGEMFEAIRGLSARGRSWDLALLLQRLEDDGIQSPPDGWYVALGSLLDTVAPEDEIVDGYVQTIKEARAKRLLERLSGRAA